MRFDAREFTPCLFAILLSSLLISQVDADVSVANIFGDNMVIQRDSAVPIWGWSDAGDDVTVVAKGQSATTVADVDGRWSVELQPIAIGEPFNIRVIGSHNEIEIKNVLAGEVWICGGQSNMAWTVERSDNPKEEINNANYPLIRQIKIGRQINTQPQDDVANSGWQSCSPKTAADFTAVGYYFARKLHQETDLPIGLINCNWGGTPIEAWTGADSLRTHPDYAKRIEAIEYESNNLDKFQAEFEQELEQWKVKHKTAIESADTNANSDLDDSTWKEINVPGQWEQQGYKRFDGLAWYRKRFEIPQEWVGKELTLSLAKADDIDRTFVNGKMIGSTAGSGKLRNYKIPSGVNDTRELNIAVQIQDHQRAGGLTGPAQAMAIKLDKDSTMEIAGSWKFKTSTDKKNLPRRPNGPGFHSPHNPTSLFNGMLHPIVPYGVRGAIWYQGESNAARAHQYRSLFPLLIQDWRSQWKKELPFYWVQLANFKAAKDEPGDSDWAELREAQSMSLKLPATGQAVIIDIGNAKDIHPKNKQDVGKRLAYIALNKHYGIAANYSGPKYSGHSIEGNRVRLQFEFADGLKASDSKPLSQFAIAGKDKKFIWANAAIEGNEVIVYHDDVPEPAAVRYAWADNPAGCNLTNASELPASPFRTDDWPGITVDRK